MTSQPFHLRLRDARRQQHLTQLQLAQKAGCTQSALSMFESGQNAALATETIAKIARLLGVEPVPASPGPCTAMPPPVLRHMVCPGFECLSNFPVLAAGEILLHPLLPPLPATARFCPCCGEVLLAACPHCGAPFTAAGGACCTACGKPFIPATLAGGQSPAAWLRNRRDDLAEWQKAKTNFPAGASKPDALR